jgi:hypothetical protein
VTAYRVDLGYVHVSTPRKRERPKARVEGVRELQAEGVWEAEVLRACGRRTWLYRPTRECALLAAHALTAKLNEP